MGNSDTDEAIMRITRVQIKGFRSLRDIDLGVPQICALVGPNNSGKSNVLSALQHVLGRDWVTVSSFDLDDVYHRDPEGDISITVSLNPPIGYAKFRGADPTSIHGLKYTYTRYKVGARKGERRFEQTCLDDKGEPPIVLARVPKKGEQRKYEPLVGIPQEVKDAIPLIYIGTNRSLKEQLPNAKYSMLRQMLEDVDRDLHDPTNTVEYRDENGTASQIQRASRFQALMDQAMGLLRTETFIKLEQSIKKNALRQLGFDPEIDADKLDLFFSPLDTLEFYKLLDLQLREGDFAISATELGEGLQNVLVLAILQAFEEHRKKGAILLIEEPEMFLHPQKQRSLYKTLREIGKTNQIVYATHSPHFVCVPEYQEVVLFRQDAAGTTVRASMLPADARRKEKLRKELDPERNELFFATRLLLVEGDTEKLALPEFARRVGIDLDRVGATIVEVGGKRSLPEFVEIATSFGIPTGVLFDEDASDFGDKDEERRFNEAMKGRDSGDGKIKVWMLSRDFEAHMRRAVGDDRFQALCQKYPGVSKPIRARLIACDADMTIPEPLTEVLNWLGEGTVSSARY